MIVKRVVFFAGETGSMHKKKADSTLSAHLLRGKYSADTTQRAGIQVFCSCSVRFLQNLMLPQEAATIVDGFFTTRSIYERFGRQT